MGDGALDLRGGYIGELGESIRRLVEAEADAITREARDLEHQADYIGAPSSRAQRLAEGLARLVRKGAGVDLSSTRAPVTEIVLVMRPDQPGRITNLDGHALRPSILKALSCVASIRPLYVDDDGNPLWMGDLIRYASPAQRRALAVRDGGCAFPGCDCPPSWCDAHHVIFYEDQGPTDIDNLTSCKYAHRRFRCGGSRRRTRLAELRLAIGRGSTVPASGLGDRSLAGV